SNEDAFGLRILLLDQQEKLRHLADVEAATLAADQCPGVRIQAAGNASLGPVARCLHGSWGRSSPFGVGLGGCGLASIGVLILIEEDEALGHPHREHAGLGNGLHLLRIERIGRSDVDPSTLITDPQASEQEAFAGQGQTAHPRHRLPQSLLRPARAVEPAQVWAAIQQFLQVVFDLVWVARGKKPAYARALCAPASRLGPRPGSGQSTGLPFWADGAAVSRGRRPDAPLAQPRP